MKPKDLEPREQVRTGRRDVLFPAREPLGSRRDKGEAKSPAAEDRRTEASPVFCGCGGQKQGSEAYPERFKTYGLWPVFWS